ncbi:hypothetical protein [Laspinema olomoucense]|uniref:hypothetical protein n=1 Tax=Laspinema olomoucense TaxID=3231600 RepID=UPI0021BABF77|nr:hypothetical protein [Laspinema sp. D3d]
MRRSHFPISVGADSYLPKPNFQAIASLQLLAVAAIGSKPDQRGIVEGADFSQ